MDLSYILSSGKLISTRFGVFSESEFYKTEVLRKTEFLASDVSMAERIYCFHHNITKQHLCKICGSKCNFCSFKKGYFEYCSTKCSRAAIALEQKKFRDTHFGKTKGQFESTENTKKSIESMNVESIINEDGSILSYANRRWSVGNVYEKTGFQHLHTSKPNYFYFDPKTNVLESRLKYQKHKLNDDQDKTESDIMFERGYRKIWDCGNEVYYLHK
jgi:hypothetical protein